MSSRVLKRRRSSQRKRPWLGFLYVLGVFSVMFYVGLFGVFTVGNAWLADLPDYSDANAYNFSQKTQVYANDRKTLIAEFYLEDRDPVEMDEISPYVVKGTVATEDQRFYDHHGIDPQGILRAVAVNLFGIGHEGASTITQQLVRNTILASEASESTLKRKVREAYIAVKMEEQYSKEEILLMYLNTINYGSGVYGIQAASQRYFSKNADELTIAEAAALIGIPQSPTYNNPIDHPDACKTRRNLVLGRMLVNEVITQEEYDEACAAPLKLKVKETKTSNGLLKYPYFSSYIRDTLLEMYDFDMVYKGGLTVYSTLDPKLQKYAEGVNLLSNQDGVGIAPVIGIDWKVKNFNFAAKYEFKTQIRMKNESSVIKASEIAAVNRFRDGEKVNEDAPALLTLGAQWKPIEEISLNLGWHHFFDKDANWYNNSQDLLRRNTNEYLAGVEWNVTDRLNVSCGGQLTRYGLTDEYMNDMSFVVNSYSLGFGFSYKVKDNITVSAAYFQTNYGNYNRTNYPEPGVSDSFTRTNRVLGVGCQLDL